MNHKLQKDVKRYLRTISKQIPKDYPNKSTLMDMLYRNLDEYLTEHPESTLDSMIEEFGSPTKIAASFIEEMPENTIVETFQKKHRLYFTLSIACFLCFIIFVFILKYVYNWYQNDALIAEETLYVTDDTEFPTECKEKFEKGEDSDGQQ